jgi:hypothetical protein
MARSDFYVYELIDPRTSKPFYVGKGTGDRFKEYYKQDSRITSHTRVILEDIKLSGQSVEVKIVAKNLSEEEAINFEADLIKKYGRSTKDVGGILTNVLAKDKPKSKIIRSEYATIQIRNDIKEQVTDFCNRKGYKIGRFIENLFLQAVSGSTSGSAVPR